MNWLDLLVLLILLMAIVKGFQRGFIIELASLVALVGGIWAAVRFGGKLGSWLGLGPDREALAVLVTFLAILLVVHLLARALTTVIDLAMLGLPNKIAGAGFGTVRAAFTLSILFNLLAAWSDGTMPAREVRSDSVFHDPIRSFAPIILPPLGETKWVKEVMERFRNEAQDLLDQAP